MQTNQVVMFFLALVCAFALAACEPETPTGPGPRAWIDAPLDGETLEPGTLIVISHSTNYIPPSGSPGSLLVNRAGITEINLYVNGAIVRTDLNPNPEQPGLVRMEQPWSASSPGDYVLVVRAKNKDGMANLSLPVRVRISAAVARGTFVPSTRTPTATTTPTSVRAAPATFTKPASTPPTAVLTASPTNSPIPASATPTLQTPIPQATAAPQVEFFADAQTLIAGQCTSLHWRTQFVQAVFLNNDPVTGNEDRPVCPPSSTAYTLRVNHAGGTITRQITLQVSAPPNTATRTATPTRTTTPTRTRTPTPIQPPTAPSNLHIVGTRKCSAPDQIKIGWNDNSNNETGYRVWRRFRYPDTAWETIATLGAGVTQYTDSSGLTVTRNVEYGVEAYNSGGASTRPTLYVSGCPF